jgi:pimeloyl-ACP methyl ester carboxylesterase
VLGENCEQVRRFADPDALNKIGAQHYRMSRTWASYRSSMCTWRVRERGAQIAMRRINWTLPEYKAFVEQLATFCRVVVFDKAGVGLSDPVPRIRSVDDRAAEIEAVMDAVGFEKAALFGLSEGGPASIVYAAKRPERMRALILHGTYAFLRQPVHREPMNGRDVRRRHGGSNLPPRQRRGPSRNTPLETWCRCGHTEARLPRFSRGQASRSRWR